MAKRYKQLESGLSVPASYGEGLIRRRPRTHRNFLFTPGGGPAPGCHCGCIVVSDDFNRSPFPSTPGDAWTIKSGTWSVEYLYGGMYAPIGYGLKGVGESTKILWHQPMPEMTLAYKFGVYMPTPYDRTFSIYLFCDEDGVGPRLDVSVASDRAITYRLFDEGGSQVGGDRPGGTLGQFIWNPLTVCIWSEGDQYVICAVKFNTAYSFFVQMDKLDSTDFPGLYFGLGADSGTIYFNDYYVEQPGDGDCDSCVIPCPDHLWSETPSCLHLVVGGVVSGTCDYCDCWNRGYYVPRFTDPYTGLTCYYRDTKYEMGAMLPGFTQSFCGSYTVGTYTYRWEYWQIQVIHISGHYYLQIMLSWRRSSGMYGTYLSTVWRKDLGTDKPDMMNLDETGFSLVQDDINNPLCDVSNITLHVTSAHGSECVVDTKLCGVCLGSCGERSDELIATLSGFGSYDDAYMIEFYATDGTACYWKYEDDDIRITLTLRHQQSYVNVYYKATSTGESLYTDYYLPTDLDCTTMTLTYTSGAKTIMITVPSP